MLPITRKISAYNHSSGNNIKYIVMHDTGNYKDTASANANYFNGGDKQASAHYFVDDNSIYQVVEDYNAAWHCGDGHGTYGISNYNSIGIEMCNSGGYISETTIKNTLELVKYIMKKYNVSIDRVVRHYDASRKCCPNNMSANNWAKWNEFKSRLSGVPYTTPTSSTTGGNGGSYYNVKEVQKMLINIGYPCGSCGADGVWGNGTKTAVEAFQKDCNLTIDGWVGEKTYTKIKAEYNKKVNVNVLSTSNINLDGKTGTIDTPSGVNVREKKSTSSRILGALPNGTKVQLYRKEGDWVHIYYPPHGGYVYGKYIRY